MEDTPLSRSSLFASNLSLSLSELPQPRLSTPQESESLISSLLENENSLDMLLERIKNSHQNAKEASIFLKKRAQLEEDYAKGLQKLCSSTTYSAFQEYIQII